MQVDNLVNRKFGRLLVLRPASAVSAPAGEDFWHCRCDCGTERPFRARQLRDGTQSCGCLRRERCAAKCKSRATHGKSRTPEYRIWVDMRRRCNDPKRDAYPHYGAKGIRVCTRWEGSFEAFLTDVGPRLSPLHSLDRHPNSSGDYEPGNVRWATQVQQQNNRISNRTVEYRGERTTLRLAVERAGSIVSRETAQSRVFLHGWDVERAVETPPDQRRTRKNINAA